MKKIIERLTVLRFLGPRSWSLGPINC